MARAGRGNYVALFLLCVAFASLTTIFLNLDTTAVLLTPVMLALAARADRDPAARHDHGVARQHRELLLPVSNLTNLLAADRVALETRAFAARMWAPQLAVVAVTMALLWAFYWRRRMRGDDAYDPPDLAPIRDPVLFSATGGACLLFIGAILAGVHTGIQLGIATTIAAAVAVVAFAVRDRSVLRPVLIPWQLMVFVTGLFLVVPTLERWGLDDAMRALVGHDGDAAGTFRAAFSGAGLSNVLNNLPAYVAGSRPYRRRTRTSFLLAHWDERGAGHHSMGFIGHAAVVRVVPPVGRARTDPQVRPDRGRPGRLGVRCRRGGCC